MFQTASEVESYETTLREDSVSIFSVTAEAGYSSIYLIKEEQINIKDH